MARPEKTSDSAQEIEGQLKFETDLKNDTASKLDRKMMHIYFHPFLIQGYEKNES